MAEFVDYKEVPFGDKIVWDVDRDLVRGRRGKVAIVDVGVNYVIKTGKDGNVYIDYNNYNTFESLKSSEKRGLYDLYIDNHMDIPDTISKESPCYKQFMKELEGK